MDDVGSIISGLSREIDQLKSTIAILTSKIVLLESENKFLRSENGKLKEKLGLTSKNSFISSSKELYKLKRNKVRSIRNRGVQPGHAGTTRGKLEADEVIDLPISDGCSCVGSVTIFSNPYIDQKVDLPDIKPHVVDYHLHDGRCRRCGKGYTCALPKGVTRDTFGPNIKSVIGALTGFYKNSKREVSCILKDIFNVDISLGTISNSESRVAATCQEAYQARSNR